MKLLVPSLAAMGAALACWQWAQPAGFTVLSWNVLAREYTGYNRGPPGCVQGHLNPNGTLETEAQTARRYQFAVEALLARSADAVLLQEVSPGFLEDEGNPAASSLLAQYSVAMQASKEHPGTAVLLRKAGPLRALGKALSVGGSKKTGGSSKSGSAVLAELAGRRLWLISVHLAPWQFNAAAVRAHLELLAGALAEESEAPPRWVLAGDFNAEVDELREMQRQLPLLGALARAQGLGASGLTADFSKACTIDHLLLSPGWKVLGKEREREPAPPYGKAEEGPAPVVAASDHAWQLLRLSLH